MCFPGVGAETTCSDRSPAHLSALSRRDERRASLTLSPPDGTGLAEPTSKLASAGDMVEAESEVGSPRPVRSPSRPLHENISQQVRYCTATNISGDRQSRSARRRENTVPQCVFHCCTTRCRLQATKILLFSTFSRENIVLCVLRIHDLLRRSRFYCTFLNHLVSVRQTKRQLRTGLSPLDQEGRRQLWQAICRHHGAELDNSDEYRDTVEQMEGQYGEYLPKADPAQSTSDNRHRGR